MAFEGDPYRVLGLARGATLEEVKRAYRRLAKTHHPDAAGSGTLDRFLAIQAAYEQLVSGVGRGPARPRGPSAAPRRASEADPERAEATRRAYGGRSRTRGTAGQSSARGGAAGGSDGDRDAASGDRARATGRQAGPGGPSASGSPTEGGSPGADTSGAGAEGRGGPDPEAARRHGKATLGSTSYDDANTGPFDPDWSGASWYGTTSGTYWTINPREYADPRKHGPEYQARARRASSPRHGPTANGVDDLPPAADREASPRDSMPHSAPPGRTTPPGERARAAGGNRDAGPSRQRDAWWDSPSEAGGPFEAAGRPSTGPAAARSAPRPIHDERPSSHEPVPDPARAVANLVRALTDPRTGGSRGRVIRAIVGWLPIALGIGWLVGEVTGCGRFAATCDPAVSPLILLVQGGVLVVLLLSPLLSSFAVAAALGLLAMAVAATLVLSATGAAADEGTGRATLGVLLVLAWLAGLVIAIAQRARGASSRTGPVS
jgi:curved DNA-binding protein CbpA